jgi:protein-disulfide isomerase
MAKVKQQVQAPRKRPVQAPKRREQTPRRRQASPRVLIAAAAVLLAVGVGVGIGVALTGSSSSSLKQVPAVGNLLRGIPQQGNVLGSPSAPVKLVEYVDMQCPYCDAFSRRVFPGLVRNYVRPGTVKMVVRPLAFIGQDSVRGRNAILAAGRQGKLFNLMELLYFNQGAENTGWLSENTVTRAGTAVGLDLGRFNTDRSSSSVATAASSFDALARSQRIHSTPTVLVGRTGGTLSEVQLASPTDAASVVNAIQLLSGQ